MNTPITIDTKDNTITARELYEFLELNPTQYARWAKKNIEDNAFAEEGIDYKVIDIQVENPQGGRPSQNCKLTIDFAKKLCMISKSPKGEAARNYFIEVEKASKLHEMIGHQSLSTRSIANKLGLSQGYVVKLLKLHGYPTEIKEQIKEGNVGADTIRSISKLENHRSKSRLYPMRLTMSS